MRRSARAPTCCARRTTCTAGCGWSTDAPEARGSTSSRRRQGSPLDVPGVSGRRLAGIHGQPRRHPVRGRRAGGPTASALVTSAALRTAAGALIRPRPPRARLGRAPDGLGRIVALDLALARRPRGAGPVAGPSSQVAFLADRRLAGRAYAGRGPTPGPGGPRRWSGRPDNDLPLFLVVGGASWCALEADGHWRRVDRHGAARADVRRLSLDALRRRLSTAAGAALARDRRRPSMVRCCDAWLDLVPGRRASAADVPVGCCAAACRALLPDRGRPAPARPRARRAGAGRRRRRPTPTCCGRWSSRTRSDGALRAGPAAGWRAGGGRARELEPARGTALLVPVPSRPAVVAPAATTRCCA